MDNPPREIVIPVEQAEVPFFDRTIVAMWPLASTKASCSTPTLTPEQGTVKDS